MRLLRRRDRLKTYADLCKLIFAARRRGIDFAHALHLASSAAAERFVTFDARLVKRVRKDSPVPVVLA